MIVLYTGINREKFNQTKSAFDALGLKVSFEAHLETAIRQVDTHEYSAIIIEGKTLEADGATLLDAIVKLRKTSSILCVGMISEDRCEKTELACLAADAALCLQPTSSSSLIAKRIERVITIAGPASIQPNAVTSATFGITTAYPDESYCIIEGNRIKLTTIEVKILYSLTKAEGGIKSRNQLMDITNRDNIHVSARTIDSHIKRLRNRLVDKYGGRYGIIETVYKMGYRLDHKPKIPAAKSIKQTSSATAA
jgi:DNA-binding response OmpR family regulator